MITPMQLYWITRLDGLCILFIIAMSLFLLAAGVFAIAGFVEGGSVLSDDSDETSKRYFRWSLKSCIVGLTILTLGCFVPSTKEMAAIVVVPRIANSESVQEIGGKIVDLATAWLEELAPKKEKAAE